MSFDITFAMVSIAPIFLSIPAALTVRRNDSAAERRKIMIGCRAGNHSTSAMNRSSRNVQSASL